MVLAKTVVVEGTADCNACMFGVGGVRPNGMTLIGGTSTCLLGLSEEEFHVDGVNGTYPNCMYDGTSLLEGGQTAAGSILTWFKNNLLPAAWMQEAVNRNMNIYDLITEKASEVPIGCDGLVMMDYFQGNRAPYADSKQEECSGAYPLVQHLLTWQEPYMKVLLTVQITVSSA